MFADAVENGRKAHTIRLPRARPTSIGDRLWLYTGQYTQARRLLLEVTCTRVVQVRLDKNRVWLDGEVLDFMEATRLSIADGFFDLFIDLMSLYGFLERIQGLPIELELIEWEVKR